MSALLKLVRSVVRQSWWLFVLAVAVILLQGYGWDRAWQAASGPVETLVGATEVAWPLLLAAAAALWRYRRANPKPSRPQPRPPTATVTRSNWPLVLLAVAVVALFAACIFVVPGLLVPRLHVSATEATSNKDRLQLENDRLKARNDARTALLPGVLKSSPADRGSVVVVLTDLTGKSQP